MVLEGGQIMAGLINRRNILFIGEKHSGFTLIELMVTLAVSSLVMIGTFQLYENQQASYTAQDETVVLQQTVRAAMNLMVREIRMGAYSPVDHQGEITTADDEQLVFTNEDPSFTDGRMQTIQYDLYDAYADGDTDIGRTIGAGPKRPLAENIDALEIRYLDEDGDPIATPITGNDLDDITTIQISILARSARPDPKYINFDPGNGLPPYVPASCRIGEDGIDDRDDVVACVNANVSWQPFYNNRDNFRRRLLVSTVQLRNFNEGV